MSMQRELKANTASLDGNLKYHGGPVLTDPVVNAVFEGSFTSSSDVVKGIDRFYRTYGGTVYADTGTVHRSP